MCVYSYSKIINIISLSCTSFYTKYNYLNNESVYAYILYLLIKYII